MPSENGSLESFNERLIEELCGSGSVSASDAAAVSSELASILLKQDEGDDAGKNDDRAGWAASALLAFMAETRTDPSCAVRDLLCNIRHLCDRVGLDFENESRIAQDNYRDEIGGEKSSEPGVKVIFEWVYPDEDGGHCLAILNPFSGKLLIGGEYPDDAFENNVRKRVWVDFDPENLESSQPEAGIGADFPVQHFAGFFEVVPAELQALKAYILEQMPDDDESISRVVERG